MGPRLRSARNQAKYYDAILHLAQEDDNGNIVASLPPAACNSHAQKAKVKEKECANPWPPTEASKQHARKRREKQREDRLVRNQQDIKAHAEDVFFPDPPSFPQQHTPPCPSSSPLEPILDGFGGISSPLKSRPYGVSRRSISPLSDLRPPAPPSTSTEPIPRPKPTRQAAQDVWYFFQKGVAGQTKTACRFCT
jgi:hypothetical protein